MYCTEANTSKKLTDDRLGELTVSVPLRDLIEISSQGNQIIAKFVSQESAENYAKILRSKGQPAVVYEGK